jgi:hypothetical protein
MKTGEGCLKKVEFEMSRSPGPSDMLPKDAIKLSGLLLKARRSKSAITTDESSWNYTAESIGI